MWGVAFWIVFSCVLAEVIGYFLHRLLHSDRIRWLSKSHMIHHLLIYGPQRWLRPSSNYLPSVEGRAALGHIGLEWLAPIAIFISAFVGLFTLLGVPALHQGIFIAVSLIWGFVMFSYLHDAMHIQGFWMEKNRFFRRWFVGARNLHDIHHQTISADGLMPYNFGIGFYVFDRLFGSMYRERKPLNPKAHQAALERYSFIQR